MDLQLAKGVRDIPPEEKIVMNRMLETLRKNFELYGFVPLETPMIERWETLTAKGGAGEESDALRETFKLKDQGNRDLALRFDLTVPLARYVAMNPQLKLPFKRYEMGPVFRDGPIKLGRYRQFWQCDVDTVGVKGMLAEAEQLALVQSVFQEFGIDIVIKVNNRKLLNGILEQCGIKRRELAIVAIDKLEKIGIKGVSEELRQRSYSDEQIDKIFEFIQEDITLEELENKITAPEGIEGLKELEELFNYLKEMKVTSAKFEISLARGLGYYTGTVFEAFSVGGPVSGSLVGGGRYDDMVGKFAGGGRDIAAVGLSFGLAPIMDTLKAKEKNEQKTAVQAYIIPIQTIKESLGMAQQLRSKGIAVDMDLNGKGVGKNMEYVNTLRIPYAIIIGENELKQKKLLLRDMKTGEQQLLNISGAIKILKKR